MIEVTTVADDEVVLHDGSSVTSPRRARSPTPSTSSTAWSSARCHDPAASCCARFATVNDVHFGETECGVIEGFEVGPGLPQSSRARSPYPELMNRAAIAEIAAHRSSGRRGQGRLTDRGRSDEYDAFLECYGRVRRRLHHIRGNHDAYHGETFAADAPVRRRPAGRRFAVIDTAIPRHQHGTGHYRPARVARRVEPRAESDRPVLVFGHHHVWSPEPQTARRATSASIPTTPSGSSTSWPGVRALVGYFAGHTHRNRVRRFAATGDVPWVEVACVKDFPGSVGGVPRVRRRHPAGAPPHLHRRRHSRGPRGPAACSAASNRVRVRHARRPLLPDRLRWLAACEGLLGRGDFDAVLCAIRVAAFERLGGAVEEIPRVEGVRRVAGDAGRQASARCRSRARARADALGRPDPAVLGRVLQDRARSWPSSSRHAVSASRSVARTPSATQAGTQPATAEPSRTPSAT